MSDDEFSSWFNHDGGPCPLPVGTLVIRELQKTQKGVGVVTKDDAVILKDDPNSFVVLSSVTPIMFQPGNSWEWKYFKKVAQIGRAHV